MAVFQDVAIDVRRTVEDALRSSDDYDQSAVFEALADAHTGDGHHGGLCDDEIEQLACALTVEQVDNAIALLGRTKAVQEGGAA